MTNISNQSAGLVSSTKGKAVVLAVIIAGGMALPFLISTQRAQAENDHRERFQDLVGSWSGQTTIEPPGAEQTFMVLDTFNDGGGFMESNTGPGAGQPDAHGNWVRTGRNQFSATEIRFGFDADHRFVNINKIRTQYTLNERTGELTGKTEVDIFLPDGTMLPIHPVASYRGTRIAIEPVN